MPAPRFGNWLRCAIQLRADSGVLVLVIDVVADVVGAVVIDEDTAIEVVGAIAVEEDAPVDRDTCGRTATSFLVEDVEPKLLVVAAMLLPRSSARVNSDNHLSVPGASCILPLKQQTQISV